MVEVARFEACTKRYRRHARPALAGMSFTVPSGRVTALLGPNGAGKSTVLRAALGLLRLSGGAIELFGTRVDRDLWRVAGRVGAVLDTPTWFRRDDVATTLELLARPRGVPRSRVPAVLDQVGLGDLRRSRIATLSLGMRRRLAIAAAMLHEPDLLLLDEPANGLDPEGSAQLRTFLRGFADGGGAVLLSSHLLADVQQLVDDVVVVDHGRVVEAGPLRSLLPSSPGYEVRVAGPADHAANVLRRAGVPCRIEVDGGGRVLRVPASVAPERISLALAGEGIGVTHLAAIEVPLEARYLELVGDPEGTSWGR